ncbi:hypothetical protein [Deinococcus piscis]|nr:hypothetical protein [Deinococcus piscis]
MCRLWPLIMLPVGYVAAWFVFGLPVLPLALLLAGVMLGLAYAEGRASGVRELVRLVLCLVGTLGLASSLYAAALRFKPHSGFEWAHIVLPLAALGAGLSLLLLRLVRRSLRRWDHILHTPITPWTLLVGALTFAFSPAVRVDCRGLQSDDFLSFSSDFQDSLSGPRWVKHPEQLPGQSELPKDFVVAEVRAGVVGCQRTPFSLEPVHPMLLVHLTDKVQPGMTTYAAAFGLSDHRKLTPWIRVQDSPFSISSQAGWTYRVPGWNVSPSYAHLPPELAAHSTGR